MGRTCGAAALVDTATVRVRIALSGGSRQISGEGIGRRGTTGFGIVRISAIFIAICMVLIAGSLGVVIYLRFGLTGMESVVVALGVLMALGIYNAIAARTRDRTRLGDQITTLSRSANDLARQLSEYGHRLGDMEAKVDAVLDKALTTAQPLAAELEELSTLVKQLADSVAGHDLALAGDTSKLPPALTMPPPSATPVAAVAIPATATTPASAPPLRTIAAFAGMDNVAIIAALRNAIEGNKIDLYLQPIVTLPQRKVRYYEALSRLKADNGDIVAAGDFLPFVEAAALLPKLDNLSVLRCVQVVRRLLLNNREIGLFCNLSTATLTDGGFGQFVEFIEANRAIAPSLVFEFSQRAVRGMGPIEHEGLAALADRGFRFSMDNLADLRVEPRELNERGFRFIKVPAALLLNRAGAASTDIHPADFSDLLGRYGIDLVAERIETESTVVDLLDYDVRFGQGFLFSTPRPVRADALQGGAADAGKADTVKRDPPKADPPKADPPKADPPKADAVASARSALAQLARIGSGRK
jgi:cyclic-di-GMP phosphodiesterase TipF (flagellum assembly factor)